MAEYPDDAYKPAFAYYNTLPTDVKRQADKFMTENYAKGRPSPQQMQQDLEGILAKYQPKKQSHAPSSTRGIFSGRMQHAAGLATVLIAVALASLGMPYASPPILY
ncbi:hypothetical protein J4234_04890 [Candidatus Woesearchaeota archaeon]|nr:hypothetical protein [Candidatus Woesearchaeota archaeon]